MGVVHLFHLFACLLHSTLSDARHIDKALYSTEDLEKGARPLQRLSPLPCRLGFPIDMSSGCNSSPLEWSLWQQNLLKQVGPGQQQATKSLLWCQDVVPHECNRVIGTTKKVGCIRVFEFSRLTPGAVHAIKNCFIAFRNGQLFADRL
jgi:hypothetical protein